MTTITDQPQHDEHHTAQLARLIDDRVLKSNDTFGIFDQHGDINAVVDGEQGVFFRDTRHLSRYSLRINGTKPVLLGSAVRHDNAVLVVDLANPDWRNGEHEQGHVRFGTLHIHRLMFLTDARMHDRITVHNYGDTPLDVTLRIEFAADYRDIFEVRGEQRDSRGEQHEPECDDDSAVLSYDGLDSVTRRTRLEWSTQASAMEHDAASLHLLVQPHQSQTLTATITLSQNDSPPPPLNFDDALAASVRTCTSSLRGICEITTDNERFNQWINRAVSDVRMMVSHADSDAPYPYAGVPWYCTVFGRDGLTVALQTLWCCPELAHGVLRRLGSMQAESEDAEADAEPGKILHELRQSEMAATGEIPFARYYGTVDATPLFVMLAGRYFRHTGDLESAAEFWPNIERALSWIDDYGLRNHDGFVYYHRKSAHGLANQGWKDSFDAVMHADGRPAKGPIALAEVQGYTYAARRLAAVLARALDRPERSRSLLEQAEAIKQGFDKAFWSDAIGTYAMALDDGHEPCLVRASNPGHCLFTGIVPQHRAEAVVTALMAEDMYSGWGVRTLSADAPRYNPTAYHNGSVWPHDNSILAAGMARYGYTRQALRVMTSLYEAGSWFDRHRLPELFCGFERSEASEPVGYPVACSPQSWASASVFLLISAALGLYIDAPRRRVTMTRPALPQCIGEMHIRNLRVGDATIDLALRRRGETVDVAVPRHDGDVAVLVRR